MAEPWNEGVRGTQVLPLINLDADIIRVEAGPGTGKTFGLVRRVQRIVHPAGLSVDGRDVLVVAFNRVIAQQLRSDVEKRLAESEHRGDPVIRTIHALCLEIIGKPTRILMDHEREAMIYDVLEAHPKIGAQFSGRNSHKRAEQALREHEAGHRDEHELWSAVQGWLRRHKAQLISELPTMLLDHLRGGDFGSRRYQHVIVDEFQDLTAAEQQLVFRLLRPDGQLMALGDPRQSIYAFRGNDRSGLAKLESLSGTRTTPITDLGMTECQRCPASIVDAANRLMALYGATPMTPGRSTEPNVHVVHWRNPQDEAKGMAAAIVRNVEARPTDSHLVMVTRRQFGYMLREEIAATKPDLAIEMTFSESLLESWPVREAFLFFCLLADPDPPTWRAWLGYQNPGAGRSHNAPKRNAPSYLRFLDSCSDNINAESVLEIGTQSSSPGGGGTALAGRARRYRDLKGEFDFPGPRPRETLERIFSGALWISADNEDSTTASLDMGLIKSLALTAYDELADLQEPSACLRDVARSIRYDIATREPPVPKTHSALQIATLWGAKGVTADHVYVLGVCREAIPGSRRDDYPGTDNDYFEEQRRLFYVTVTRAATTLVLSRCAQVRDGDAKRLGLTVGGRGYWRQLEMSPFFREIKDCLPEAINGSDWNGCVVPE